MSGETYLNPAVLAGIDALPEPERALLLLHDIQGMTLDEVGQALDIGRTTVKTHLMRARHALRVRLDPLMREALP